MPPRKLRSRAAAVGFALLLIAATSVSAASPEASVSNETLAPTSTTANPTATPSPTAKPPTTPPPAVATPPSSTTVKPTTIPSPTSTITPKPATTKPATTKPATTKPATTTPSPTVVQGNCLNLPRNTLLASCPAPCVKDAPCIVYDQNAAHTKLTGCDYSAASEQSFCTSQPTDLCEFHCYAKYGDQDFWFSVARELGDPIQRLPADPSLIATDDDFGGYQADDFVSFIGKLALSKKITYVEISGDSSDDSAPFVNVTVDPSLLASAPGVTELWLSYLPLESDRFAAIIESAPTKLDSLVIRNTNITSLSWKMFERLTKFKYLDLTDNYISLIAGGDTSMPALKDVTFVRNKLTGFDLQAPKLTDLDLFGNKLVRIPASVFSYTKLKNLDLGSNPLISPLVLTQQQVKFLEALPEASSKLTLVDPPDAEIVSRLPTNDGGKYGDYSDDVDLSLLLKNATETLLSGDYRLPVLVVESEKAAMYNNLLELRARNRVQVGTPAPTPAPTPDSDVPGDFCQGVPRRTLLSECAKGYCPTNGACVLYDRSTEVGPFSGCNYTVASKPSFCTNANRGAKTCEIQCFGAYQPQSQFKFFVPFKTALGEPVPREPYRNDLDKLTTTEIPFLTNSLIDTIGKLDLKEGVTEVLIAGGRSEKLADRLADVVVDPYLLAKAPTVTSLTLLNIDLSKSELPKIFKYAWQPLEKLTLHHTNIVKLPAGTLGDTDELTTLSLAQNGLTVFDMGTKVLPKLTTLDLSDNSLTTVSINAPKLKTLVLSGNNLAGIPPGVFDLKALQALDLKNNAILFPLVLSQEQVTFLNSIADVRFDAPANSGDSPGISTGPSAGIPSGTSSGTSPTAVPGNGAAANSGAVPLPNGATTLVKGVPVIIVSEPVAKEYNDKLEQKQKESTPTTRPRTGGGTQGSTPGKTRVPSSDALNATGLSNGKSLSSGSGSSYYDGSGDDLSRDDVGWTEMPSGAAGSSSRTNGSETTTTPASKEDATTTTKAANGMSLATKLALGGVGLAFFVILAVVLLILLKRRKRETNQEANYAAMADQGDEATGPDIVAGSGKIVPWWNDEAMLSHRLNAGDISDVRVIGSGASGVVWLVNYRSGTRKLVSKRLIEGEGAAYNAKLLQLYAEAKIGTELRYPSVVQFVGVAWTDKTDFQVLYEYMSNGDLSAYLAKTDPVALPWLPNKLLLAIDIIEALVYAHSFNPPLLHRDLKASNVLLDDEFKAKLGDFGCARPESDSNTMTTNEIGTGRWLAPEILLGSTSYGTPSDIYSFGVVLCELDTHQVPYVEHTELSESALLQRVARGELRPTVSESCPPEIREMAEACLAFDPAIRPTAMQVSYKLRQLQKRSRGN